MDLSNLSSNLPLSAEPSEEAINNINKELADEFKIGARSIAALYRLSNTKNSLLIAKGYLDCINHISKLLENGSISSINDVKQFIDTRKHELSINSNDDANSNTNCNTKKQNSKFKSETLTIDPSYKFTVNNPTNRHFPSANTPLSIDHSNLKYYERSKQMKKNNSHTISSSTDDEDEEVEDDDHDLNKIKFHSSDSQHDLSPIDENTDSFSKRKIIDSNVSIKKQKF